LPLKKDALATPKITANNTTTVAPVFVKQTPMNAEPQQTPMTTELPSFVPRVLLAPIRKTSASGLASLADLPTITGGKIAAKKTRKSTKKNKKMDEKVSRLNGDLDSLLGSL